ncbi:MAG: hypothetical protein ACW981_19325 [Candidatus Hodarchaeales archaeon]|jgi:L-asparagine transporter-like permease
MQTQELVDQGLIDISVVLFAIIYNLLIIAVYILRAHEKYELEKKIGPPFDLLFVPFGILLLLNILNNSDVGRIGTIIPMLIFLAYDFWYRQFSKRKPTHHPDKMPKELILYIILFYFAGMAIVGYAFLVSQEYGYLVLIVFMLSIVGYFYYQISHNRRKKAKINST